MEVKPVQVSKDRRHSTGSESLKADDTENTNVLTDLPLIEQDPNMHLGGNSGQQELQAFTTKEQTLVEPNRNLGSGLDVELREQQDISLEKLGEGGPVSQDSQKEAEQTPSEKPVEAENNNAEENCLEKDAGEVSDDDYDPERVYALPEPQEQVTPSTSLLSSQLGTQTSSAQNDSINEDDDDHDPETFLTEKDGAYQPEIFQNEKASSHGQNLSNESKETPTQGPDDQLRRAYDVIMQSDFVKLNEFTKLSQAEQLAFIKSQLDNAGVQLPTSEGSTHDPEMNYDQVYSFNKPFKAVKDPIPLVPINKFCRRPNITLPMTAEEKAAYAEFIRNEEKYSGWQSRDQFPENLRMFIGNLPANTITKADLFRIFKQYGEVMQISIKGGYGFVQFRTSEQCADCIRGEHNVPLHNKYMRLDASTGGKKARESNREREKETTNNSENNSSGSTDCEVLVTDEANPDFLEKVRAAFKQGSLSVSEQEIFDKDYSEVIPDIAYLGVLGVCVVKNQKLDIQTFDETEDGGIKFDEYVDLTPEQATEILLKKKPQKVEPPSKIRKDIKSPPNFNQRERDFRLESHERRNRGGQRRRERNRHNTWQHDGFHNGRFSDRGHKPRFFPPNPAFAQQVPQYFPQQSSNLPPNLAPQPPQAFQTPFSSSTNFSSSVPNIQNQSALWHTLQNLDPATMQNVISLLQQQQGVNQGVALPPKMPQGPYGAQNIGTMPQVSPPTPSSLPSSGQVSNLLSLLRQNHQNQGLYQAQQPYQTYAPYPGQSPYQNQPLHQEYAATPPPQQSSSQTQGSGTLMDMLSRLSKN